MADHMVADEAGERSILTTGIDVDFAPRPVDDVTLMELGDELILYDKAQGVLFVLDRVGATMWRLFDGEVTLGELSEEIVAALDAQVEQVQQDLIDMAKRLGRDGLLVGVKTPQATMVSWGTLEPGEELPSFTLPDMHGEKVALTDMRGHKVLLVNWSPSCGFCIRIAPDLAELAPRLAEHDVELVLLSTGTVAHNEKVFEETGLRVRTLLKVTDVIDDADDDGGNKAPEADHDHDLGGSGSEEDDEEDDVGEDAWPDPFPAMGTPAAYFLDEAGRVTAPIAVGANDVPTLARSAAGIDDAPEELPADAAYLNLAAGDVCGPGVGGGKKPRVWASTAAYQIGDYRVGIRPDSARTDELLATLLAESRLPSDARAPDDYSIVLGDGGTTARALNLVLQGGSTVIRTRSPRRALLGLAGYLSSQLRNQLDGLLRVTCLTMMINDEALILPAEVSGWNDQLQPRFAKFGGRPIDRPFVTIDPDRLEVIVDEPGIPVDTGVLEGLPEPPSRRSERPMVEPGRYPLRGWSIWQSTEEPPLTRGQLVTRAMASCLETSHDARWTLRTVDSMRERGVLVPFDFMTIDELVDWAPAAFAEQPIDPVMTA